MDWMLTGSYFLIGIFIFILLEEIICHGILRVAFGFLVVSVISLIFLTIINLLGDFTNSVPIKWDSMSQYVLIFGVVLLGFCYLASIKAAWSRITR